MAKTVITKTYQRIRPSVPGRIPPTIGKYAGWDWNTFYLAILTILQKPSSEYHYQRALETIQALPKQMVFNIAEVSAAWARFTVCFPGRDKPSAYRYMLHFLEATGRLYNDPTATWYDVELSWLDMEEGPGQLQGIFEPFNGGVVGGVAGWLGQAVPAQPEKTIITMNSSQYILGKYDLPDFTNIYQIGSVYIPAMMPDLEIRRGLYESLIAKANFFDSKSIAAQAKDVYNNIQLAEQAGASDSINTVLNRALFKAYYVLYLIKTGKLKPEVTASYPETWSGYWLMITSEGTSTPIDVDGMYVGYTPVAVKVGWGFLPDKVTPGNHYIEARLLINQYYGFHYVEPAMTTKINIPISPTFIQAQKIVKEPKVWISSSPPGAKVYIDMQDTGKITNTYVWGKDYTSGQHGIYLSLVGYEGYSGPLNILADQDTEFAVTLKKLAEAPKTVSALSVWEAVERVINGEMQKLNVQASTLPLTIHPKTYDSIVSNTISKAAVSITANQQQLKDSAYSSLTAKNIIRGYIPEMPEIMNTTDNFLFQNLDKKGIPVGSIYNTLDGSLYDEIVNNTAQQASSYLVKKTGLKLSANGLHFFKRDAEDAIKFYGFKRGQ